MNTSGIRADEVKDLLDYDPATGELKWKDRPDGSFASRRSASVFRSRWVGKRGFTAVSANGYSVGRIYDKSYAAHRVVWAIVHGEWPASDIDHINGDRSDNRIANLRCATRAQNNMNRDIAVTGGVRRRSNKWEARLAAKSLGTFGCETAARIARHIAAMSEFGAFYRGAA